ncbi:MAG: nucleotidyltransferase domain-containing protein [Pseudomonadota bacterium]
MILFKAVLFINITMSYAIAGGYKMGGSLNHMSKKERYAIERFGETVKSRLGENVIRMSVFGSKVRGDYTEKSDIDILVIVKERSLRVMDQIAEITSDLNIEFDLSIAPVVFSEHEYDMNAIMASPFSLAVHEEGLLL